MYILTSCVRRSHNPLEFCDGLLTWCFGQLFETYVLFSFYLGRRMQSVPGDQGIQPLQVSNLWWKKKVWLGTNYMDQDHVLITAERAFLNVTMDIYFLIKKKLAL